MKLRTHIKEDPGIDLTSLIDVVFLLLLFFMVSTTFERPASLQVDLPEASTATPPAPSEAERLVIVIDAQGRMYLNDAQLADGRAVTLEAAMREAAGQRRDLPLILRADRETPHHFVVTAMDVSAQLGFTNLSIAAERTDGSTQ